MIITIFSCFIISLLTNGSSIIRIIGNPSDIGEAEHLQSRMGWEFERLKDPSTNSIPKGIRRKELEFAKTLPVAGIRNKSVSWVARGPYNVGGRTRGAALDVNDENITIAGGVSGGLWRTTDGGNTWSKMTKPEQLHNVTCLVQDTRPGKTNVWYYGTGEGIGNSASESYSADFLGDGIYKSTDNGLTWKPLESTVSNTPQNLDRWDYVWNIAVDPAETSKDVVYAALFKSIQRSEDGGITWEQIFPYSASGSFFTDVAVTSQGIVYAVLSSDGLSTYEGIWRSENGTDFTRITPQGFPSTYYRIVLDINPSDENEVYFLANTPNGGQHTYVFFGGEEWNSLWKYTYLSGNGADTNGVWKNLSSNLPSGYPCRFDNFYCQGSYDLTIAVKPDAPNIVFIGGTNLYRSTDGFSSPAHTTQIGGYKPGSVDLNWDIYENHHPDQHKILFLPSNPDVLISANDGGMHKTNDCLADTVVWEKLNRGYLTSQLYTVSIDETTTSDIIVAGFQDNGNFFTNSANPSATWIMPLNGDGSFSAIADGGDNYYLSIQRGKVYRMQLDNDGYPTAFARIDPIGPAKDDYLFINPFALDPNNHNIMYLGAYKGLWRNDSLSDIPLAGNIDTISTGWFNFTYKPNYYVTAIAVSKNPANRVYYGSSGFVYRVDSANVSDANHIKYTISTASGNISCIAIDPRDADKVMAVISSYSRYSLYYSDDGGVNWYKVAGNLEEFPTGGGNGPSCRWAEIVPFGNQTLYLLGTSVGLFATDTLYLENDSTEWAQLAPEAIGNIVVEMIKTRETDNLV
ncbi:MAG: sialidase family protein, partial [bacterium]